MLWTKCAFLQATLYHVCASSPHCRLGYWSIEQRAETSIQSSEPVILHGQLHTVTWTHACTHTQHPGVSNPAEDWHTNLQSVSSHTCPSDLPIPLYRGGLALSSSCSWVLTYSVGKVIQISIPPAMPPEWEAGKERNTGFVDSLCMTVLECSERTYQHFYFSIKQMRWLMLDLVF